MFLLTTLVSLGGFATALTIPASNSAEIEIAALEEKRATKYAFNQLVVFGDEFSDNGNGSYAHGITGNQPKNYGFGTWTNGPIAASYLSALLGVTNRNLAWGGCCGGGSSGATLDNTYTTAEASWNSAPVPSLHDQIYKNYTIPGTFPNIKNAMQFLWAGQNDLNKHTDAFWAGDPQNTYFAANISSRLLADAEYLISEGAPLVMVANIYPKHLAPVTTKYLCTGSSSATCVATWGTIIQKANTAIKTALAGSKYKSKIVYYDAFTFMVDVMNAKNSYGFTANLTDFCDGDGQANWDACIAGTPIWTGSKKYFWMNYEQPTTTVHQLLAADMKKTLDAFLA